ncbi:MAG: PilT/PilU family type 4a pilus ATPase [Gammaproteobacteria bacterium]
MEREQAIKYMRDLLKLMVEKKGSDLFITVGFPPAIKVDGKVTPVSKTQLTSDNTKALTYGVMNDRQLKEFEATKECNFAIEPTSVGRFRCNAFVQRGETGMVLRTIETNVPTIDSLGLPQIIKEIVMTKRGLVIMVGGPGSGKSTSLAAMVDYRNENSYGHIVIVEDPIEYIHPHKNCIIMQREVGVDTDDWDIALKNSLRQAPDVILLGEIRDRETMEMGITFAETGHLAMATLHANSANQALDRIINFFPEDRKAQLLMDLSLNLKGVISQRLLKRRNEKGRVAAIEIMLNSPYIADLVLKGKVHLIKEVMAKSNELCPSGKPA